MVKYLVFCVCIAAGYVVYTTFPIDRGPGIMAKDEPKITRITWQEPFTFKGATLTPQKLIEAEVRIVKRKRYFFDPFSKFSPVDAVVGWNEMSDQRNLDYIYFSLDDRDFELDLTRPPLKLSQIKGESDFWHFIPSTVQIDEELKKLRDGNIIKVKGMLVDMSHETLFNYSTRTTLTDNVKKKAFLVWVEDIQVW